MFDNVARHCGLNIERTHPYARKVREEFDEIAKAHSEHVSSVAEGRDKDRVPDIARLRKILLSLVRCDNLLRRVCEIEHEADKQNFDGRFECEFGLSGMNKHACEHLYTFQVQGHKGLGYNERRGGDCP